MKHFNGLTPAEAELIALLLEECGEVVQVCGKILRHGLESVHPRGGLDNRALLCRELGDIDAACSLLRDHEIIDTVDVMMASKAKLARVRKYLHHAKAENSRKCNRFEVGA